MTDPAATALLGILILLVLTFVGIPALFIVMMLINCAIGSLGSLFDKDWDNTTGD